MKALLAIGVTLVICASSFAQNYIGYQVLLQNIEVPIYDARGYSLKFFAGEAVPVTKIILWSEADAELRKDLPKADSYIVAPFNEGAVIFPSSGKLVPESEVGESAKTRWTERQRAYLASVSKDAKGGTISKGGTMLDQRPGYDPNAAKQRYAERKSARDSKARADATAAALYRQEQHMRDLNGNLRDIAKELRR